MTRNRLADETSPYLLQHKDNPVHWWAWGPEALANAKAANKPILLSVGYAACHWCHVMAHESFEDPATAALMNMLFVNIKVDREERPDIDAIYMAALHALGQQGGWPLTMFLTQDAQPFWGGTYFPKDERYGRASFARVLREIARIHADDPARVAQNAAAIGERLSQRRPAAGLEARIEPSSIAEVAKGLANAVDPVHGGLSGAPKFPQYSVFWLLWKAGIRFDLPGCRAAVLVTLRNICQGGIHDHIGGGFARYSVDERWLVPHFEKMLYDNALLLQLLTEAWRETGEDLFKLRIGETCEFLKHRMRAPAGGLASSHDADSEGEEGKFYVWTRAEIQAVLGADDAEVFCRLYDITGPGNFEGHNIPNRLGSMTLQTPAIEQRLKEARDKLFAARGKRVAPGFDDKVLADWNGLAIVALVGAGNAVGNVDWTELAVAAYDFVVARMSEHGRLWHSWRAGQVRGPGTAADYANMIAAALALHDALDRDGYLIQARAWERTLHEHFWIEGRGGYAFTADDTTDVIVRTETAHDDATPNANGVMVSNLVCLHELTGEAAYLERAEAIMRGFLPDIAAQPSGHCGLLAGAVDLHAPMQVAIVNPGPRTAELQAWRAEIFKLSLPGAVARLVDDGGSVPANSPLAGKTAIEGRITGYVCVAGTCSLPVTDRAALRAELLRARQIA